MIHESAKRWEQSRAMTEEWMLKHIEQLAVEIQKQNVHEAKGHLHIIGHYLKRYEQDIENVIEAQKRDRLADAYKDL